MHQLWGQIFSRDRVIKFQWICISIYTKTWASHSVHGFSLLLKTTCWLYLWKAILTLPHSQDFPTFQFQHTSISPSDSILQLHFILCPISPQACKTMSWKFAHFTMCHPDESAGNNIHSFSKYLRNIHGAAVAGLDEGSQQLWSPPSGVSSLAYEIAKTLLNGAHTPHSIHWYILLVFSSWRSICIPLQINLYSFIYFQICWHLDTPKRPNVTQTFSSPTWSDSNRDIHLK